MENGMQDVVGLYAALRGAGSIMHYQQAGATNFANHAQNARPGGDPYLNASAQPSPTLRPVRTEEEIAAQLAARMAELEEQAVGIRSMEELPCKKCRWSETSSFIKCHNPLIKGFGDAPYVDNDGSFERNAKLCGPEKALWEPRLTLWERFIAWMEG